MYLLNQELEMLVHYYLFLYATYSSCTSKIHTNTTPPPQKKKKHVSASDKKHLPDMPSLTAQGG
jgi:hypothetical protein